jgi:hypothetical protein
MPIFCECEEKLASSKGYFLLVFGVFLSSSIETVDAMKSAIKAANNGNSGACSVAEGVVELLVEGSAVDGTLELVGDDVAA